MHERGAVSVKDKVSGLHEGGLCQEISYRGDGWRGNWGAGQGHRQPADENVGGVSVTRQRGVWFIGDDSRGGRCVCGHLSVG